MSKPRKPTARVIAPTDELLRNGRLTAYSESLANKICRGVSLGISLYKLCSLPGYPCRMSVYKWLFEHPTFADNFRRARSNGVESMVDELIDIADNVDEDPNSRRIRIDTRKWIASKLKPRVYGDNLLIAGDSQTPRYEVVIRSVLDDQPAPRALPASTKVDCE